MVPLILVPSFSFSSSALARRTAGEIAARTAMTATRAQHRTATLMNVSMPRDRPSGKFLSCVRVRLVSQADNYFRGFFGADRTEREPGGRREGGIYDRSAVPSQ